MSTKEEVIQLVDGLSEEELRIVKRMLQGLAAPDRGEEPALVAGERPAGVGAIRGILAHTHTSVDEFHARKREEVDLEEERYRRRHPEAA